MVFCKILLKNKVFFVRDEKGFTILELIVAMAIFTIFLSLLYPSFDGFMNKIALEQATFQMVGNIRDIKQKSIANNGTSLPLIVFVPNENYYNIYINSLKLDKKIDFNELYKNRVKILGYNGKLNTINFNYLGTPVNCGTVILQNKNGEILYVIVSAIMGRVRVSKYPSVN